MAGKSPTMTTTTAAQKTTEIPAITNIDFIFTGNSLCRTYLIRAMSRRRNQLRLWRVTSVSGNGPISVRTALTADLPDGAAARDAISIDSIAYTVRVIQPEGTGVTTLVLEENLPYQKNAPPKFQAMPCNMT